MSEFKQYHKVSKPADMRPYVPGESLKGIGINDGVEAEAGDYIARDPDHHADQWLVKADYFARNFEAV